MEGGKKMDKVVHFEIPYDDLKRVKEFYTKVFGWQINTLTEMHYNFVIRTEVDENNMAKKPGVVKKVYK